MAARLALALLALGGCARLGFDLPLAPAAAANAAAPARGGRPALTVVLARSLPRPAETRKAIERTFGKSFALAFAEPPSVPAADEGGADLDGELAAARKAYVNADFRPCLEELGEIQRVGDLLAAGKRQLGERLLFWRIACRVGAGRAADARRDAATFAGFGLEIPADVEAAAPDVEALIAEALRVAAAAPRLPLRVSASAGDAPAAARLPLHAVVSVDGRPALCVAPCTVDVPAGDHAVRVEADGFAPEMRIVRVDEGGGSAALALSPADPELAARQFTARQAAAPGLDSAAAVGLLAVALRAGSLVVVAVEPAPKGLRLAGALAQGGAVAGRAERGAASDAEVPDAATALLRDLLLRGRLLEPSPPLYARPLFWVGVGLAAVAAAGVTALLLYEPQRQTEIVF